MCYIGYQKRKEIKMLAVKQNKYDISRFDIGFFAVMLSLVAMIVAGLII